MAKIISISGTHCTGKSTLVEALKKRPELKDAIFLKSSGRALAKHNPRVKINEDGDFYTQLYQMTRDIETLLEVSGNDLVICDRSFLDTFMYSFYLFKHNKLSGKQMDIISDLKTAVQSLVRFDKVFLLRPSFDLQNEENRSMNKDFQQEMFELFDNSMLPSWEYLPDDDESRIQTFIDYVTK